MIYRGQRYGDAPGEWWTTSLEEAEKFAMAAGGNRTYVVLSLDEDPSAEWLAGCLIFDRDGNGVDRGDWYRIPIDTLRAHWRGVRIHSGAISIERPSDRGITEP